MELAILSNNTAFIYYGGFARFGGVISHARAVEGALHKMGWNVVLISLDSLPIWCRYIPHAVEKIVNFINRPLGFYYKGLITKFLYRAFFDKSAQLRIYEDIYLSWNSSIPSITVMHAIWSDNLQAFLVNNLQLEKLISKEISAINTISHPVVTVSDPYATYLKNEHFAGQLNKNIDVIELGVNQFEFKKNTSSNPYSIIYTGSLEARKNVFFLLVVFKKLKKANPSYTLTIIGDGPDRSELQKFAFNNSLDVKFLGAISRSEVINELANHRLYMHTSTKESFSYSLLEAKLAGLKTIACDKLQVPSDFIDIGIEDFVADDWCRMILNSNYSNNAFDKNKYTVEKMTISTIKYAQ